MTVSIMFVTYNRLDLSRQMMDSLLKNTDAPFRVIVVDNGSTDGTPDWLSQVSWKENPLCESFDIVLNKQNMGIAIARNQGLKAANKYNDEILSTLDNDVELSPGWLSGCLDVISANPKFVVGLNMEGVPYPTMTRNGKTFQFKKRGNLGTACTVFKRALHTEIGYFIMEYGLYGEEDADYFFRARLVGYEMAYLPQMGKHLGEGERDVGEYREFKTKSHEKNLARFNQNCGQYVHKKRKLYIPFI